jgi:hypothetical protein
VLGAYGPTIATSRADAPARQRLGLPVPGRALSKRGAGRYHQGNLDGLADIERAIELLVEDGNRSSAAGLGNLAKARWTSGKAHRRARSVRAGWGIRACAGSTSCVDNRWPPSAGAGRARPTRPGARPGRAARAHISRGRQADDGAPLVGANRDRTRRTQGGNAGVEVDEAFASCHPRGERVPHRVKAL